MALKTTVKVTINNLSDARYCAGMGVDLIGFSTNPADTFYLSPENFEEIAEWLSGVVFVAETSSNNIDQYDIDVVQIDNISLAGSFTEKQLIIKGSPEILRTQKDEILSIPNLYYIVVVIDEHKADLDSILEELKDMPVLLGFDLSIEEAEKVANSSVSGIALLGSDEIRPGFKDYDALADILESMEVDTPY